MTNASRPPSHGMSHGAAVLSRISGAIEPAIAISDPTDRSMPPVAITKVIPTATMTISATWVRLTRRAEKVKNASALKTPL